MAEIRTTGVLSCIKDTHTTSMHYYTNQHSINANASGKHPDRGQGYAFFAFEDHGIPENAVIVSATFSCAIQSRWMSANFTHIIRPCSGPWEEDTLVYSQMPTSSGVTSQITFGATSGTSDFYTGDITNIAQAWLSGEYDYANGFYITNSESSSYKSIWARGTSNENHRPRIEITYYVPASKPTFTVFSTDIANGTKVSIQTNRQSETYTHKLSWKLVKGSGTSIIAEFASNVAKDIEWSMGIEDTNKMRAFLNDTSSAMMYIVCETFDASGASLGIETSAGIMMYVPASIKPDIALVTITGNKTLNGYLVQGISTIKVDVQATPAFGTTISSSGYETKIENISYKGNPVTSSVLNIAGERMLRVIVTDSRGRTHEKEEAYTVYAYAAPKVTNIHVERCNSTGTEAALDGEKLRFSLSAQASRIYSDSINTLTVKVYTKLRTDNEWPSSPVNTYMSSTDTVNYSNYVLSGTYSGLSSYDVKFEIADKVSEPVKWETQMGTQNVLINFDPDNMRIKFGGIAEDDDVNNAVTFGTAAYFKDGMYMPDGRNVPEALAELKDTIGDMSVERIYESLSSIGCTASSTMTQVWQALPTYSCLMLEGTTMSSFNSSWGVSQLPSGLMGELVMRKFNSDSRGEIKFICKDDGCREFRMAITSSNATSGTWYCSFAGLYSATEPTYQAGVLWLKPVE